MNERDIDWSQPCLANENVAWFCPSCNEISPLPKKCSTCDKYMTEAFRPEPTAGMTLDDFSTIVADAACEFSGHMMSLVMEWFDEEDCEDGWYEDTKGMMHDMTEAVANKLGFPLDETKQPGDLVPKTISTAGFERMVDGIASAKAKKYANDDIGGWFDMKRRGPAFRDKVIVETKSALLGIARVTGRLLGYPVPSEGKEHPVERSMKNEGRQEKKGKTLLDFADG